MDPRTGTNITTTEQPIAAAFIPNTPLATLEWLQQYAHLLSHAQCHNVEAWRRQVELHAQQQLQASYFTPSLLTSTGSMSPPVMHILPPSNPLQASVSSPSELISTRRSVENKKRKRKSVVPQEKKDESDRKEVVGIRQEPSAIRQESLFPEPSYLPELAGLQALLTNCWQQHIYTQMALASKIHEVEQYKMRISELEEKLRAANIAVDLPILTAASPAESLATSTTSPESHDLTTMRIMSWLNSGLPSAGLESSYPPSDFSSLPQSQYDATTQGNSVDSTIATHRQQADISYFHHRRSSSVGSSFPNSQWAPPQQQGSRDNFLNFSSDVRTTQIEEGDARFLNTDTLTPIQRPRSSLS
jgi:hypothetical protein